MTIVLHIIGNIYYFHDYYRFQSYKMYKYVHICIHIYTYRYLCGIYIYAIGSVLRLFSSNKVAGVPSMTA